jgi:hypothetical protein
MRTNRHQPTEQARRVALNLFAPTGASDGHDASLADEVEGHREAEELDWLIEKD